MKRRLLDPDEVPPDEGYTGDTIPIGARQQPRPAAPRQTHAGTGKTPAQRPAAPGPRQVYRRTPIQPNLRPGQAAAPPPPLPRTTRPKKAQPLRGRPIPGTRSRSIRRILTRLGIAAVALVVLALGALLVLQQQVAKQVALADVRADRPIFKTLVTPLNILLLGVDSRPDHPAEGVRSDSLLLLHIDPVGGWANLLTIPRDSLATIPNYADAKINAAFAQGHDRAAELYGTETEPLAGGAALAAETVEEFLQLRGLGSRIDYMATINFDGFAAMIDALGGIDVDVPFTIIDEEYPTPDFGTMRIEIPAGRQHFNGEQALQYVRTRHADSDFGRAQRQQQVISAMLARLRSRPLPLQPFAAMRLVRAAGTAIRTTMPVGRPDALLQGLMLLRLDPATIGNYRITPDDVTLLGEYGTDLVWDPAGVQALAQQALTPPQEVPEQATIQVQNGAGIGGLAGQMTDTLAGLSFTTTAPTTADAPVERSMILDFTRKPRTRERLQQTLHDIPLEERPAAEAPPGVDLLVILGTDYEQFLP